MKEELIVPKCYYPWPTVNSPIATAFDEEEMTWWDNDYTFISEEGVRRCKKQRMSQVATYMNPTCDNIVLMRPCVRLMIYITTFDDFFALTPVNELMPIANRVYEVMLGEAPSPPAVPTGIIIRGLIVMKQRDLLYRNMDGKETTLLFHIVPL